MDQKNLEKDYNDIVQTITNIFEDFKDYTMIREGHAIVLSKDDISFVISVVTDTKDE